MRYKYKSFLLCLSALLFWCIFSFTGIPRVYAKEITTVTASSDIKAPEGEKQDIKLNVTSKAIVKGKSITLRVYGVKENQEVVFTSSDEEVVSSEVHSEYRTRALLTANKIGTAVVTVTVTENGDKVADSVCEITVGPPAISITLTLDELTLEVDQKASLKTILKPKTTAEVATFYSSDPDIVTVSAGGKVTAKGVGEATIYAQIEAENEAGKRKFAKCVITVIETKTKETTPSSINAKPVE